MSGDRGIVVELENVEFDGGDVRDINPVVVIGDSIQDDDVVWYALVSFGLYELLDVFVRWEGCLC